MKTICIIIFLSCINFISFCQDTIGKGIGKRNQIAIMAGGYYKYFWGKRYIEPTLQNTNTNFTVRQYERFTKTPTYGFLCGVLFTYRLHKNWYFISGLLYFNRKDVYKSNFDSVVTYNAVANNYSFNNIHNVVKYEYSYNNIELPFKVQYKKGKFNLCGGINLPILSFDNATYTYLVSSSQYPYFYDDEPTSQKTIKHIEIPLMIFPTLQVIYNVRIKNILICPFLGIDIGTKKSFYTQVGIILPLKNIHKNLLK